MNIKIVNGISIWLGLILIAIEFSWFWLVVIPLFLFLTFPQWFIRKKPPGEKDST